MYVPASSFAFLVLGTATIKESKMNICVFNAMVRWTIALKTFGPGMPPC